MGSAKWIVGFLGWVSVGPIGALLGFFLGSLVDSSIDAARQISSGAGGQGPKSDTGGYRRSSTYRTNNSSRGYSASEQRNSFMVSLLILSSSVIKADGKVLASELEYVKSFVRSNFGDSAVSEAMRMLDELNAKEVNIYSVGGQIASNMNYSQRLQLFHYLTQLAVADGEFSASEKSVLEAIAAAIGLASSDASSVIAMFYKDAESAYAVLEISSSATDNEVRSAYRRMAMKYHPDKVATLGEDVQKAAEEKFRKVQEAYETIKKQRGLN